MSPELSRLRELICNTGIGASRNPKRSLFELKQDGSIVTQVDVEVENILRKALTDEWAGTTVWGEELGYEESGRNGLWLVDPIDGTSNYYSGNPLWGISVALMDVDGLRLGGIVLPELNIDVLAERDAGTYWNKSRLEKSEYAPVQTYDLISVNDTAFRMVGDKIVGKPRLCGAFVVDGAFTVRRWFKALYGMNEKLYDVAASVLAAREIGLEVRYCDGSEWSEHDLSIDKKISKPWRIGGA